MQQLQADDRRSPARREQRRAPNYPDQQAADHADLQTLKTQLTRLLGEQPTATQAPMLN